MHRNTLWVASEENVIPSSRFWLLLPPDPWQILRRTAGEGASLRGIPDSWQLRLDSKVASLPGARAALILVHVWYEHLTLQPEAV
jgi:hypothetical protein